MNDVTAASVHDSKDCLACRLIGGFGAIGVGAYIFRQAKNRGKIETNIYKMLSAGAVGLGIARLLNMKFMKKKD